VFWILLLLATGVVGLAVILVVGRRCYLQLRMLAGELGGLLADAEAVGAQLESVPGAADAGEAGRGRARA
jgi:hypothetical protein